jgi:DNA-directed RNA polymerase subunit H (RpoH/RPB5)
MDTLKCLNEDEMALLLYVVNHLEPVFPKMEIGLKELPWIRQELLIQKLVKQEIKLNQQGKNALQGLIAKITRYSQHEAEEFQQQENECVKAKEFNQLMFQF